MPELDLINCYWIGPIAFPTQAADFPNFRGEAVAPSCNFALEARPPSFDGTRVEDQPARSFVRG